jgi:DNA polymerase-4
MIFHVDLDSFFVSVERLKDPSLIGKPVAVGGTQGRGVISSASYEARKFGVRSAMPTQQALALCPNLVMVKSSYGDYSAYSKRVFDVLDQFSPVVEAVSVDEGYLDMKGTERLWGDDLTAAARMREAIKSETGLTASIGMGANRRIAKIATDQAKPDGVCRVIPGTEAQFLAPLKVGVIPGVGASTQEWLKTRGIVTIGQLQAFPRDALVRHLGVWGDSLFRAAWGEGSIEFHREAKNPQASRERTFSENLTDLQELEDELWGLCSRLGRELREEGVFSRTVRLKIRYSDFETLSRSKTYNSATCVDRVIFERAWELFRTHYQKGRGVRLIGVGTPLDEGTQQWSLFGSPEVSQPRRVEREEKLESLKDQIRTRFGDRALRSARDQE